jgi:nucleoside-diphosphate-sugar epimerase
MKIMLIGGSGLIGSYLAPALQEKGHQPTVIDRRQMLVDMGYDGKHIEQNLYTNQDAEFLFDKVKPDVVVFMAATVPDAEASITSPALTMEAFPAMVSAFFAAERHGCQRFVYISGVESSSDRASPLAVLHSSSEHFLQQMLTTLDVVILRPTSIYAPGTLGKRSSFLNDLLGGHPRLKVKPNRRHDFVHVSDVVDATIGAIIMDEPHTHAQIYYISSGHPTMSARSIVELFNGVARDLDFQTVGYDIDSPEDFGDLSYEESDTQHLTLFNGSDERPLDLETGFHKLISYQKLLESQ